LPREFVDYLREDRIILADDDDDGDGSTEDDDWEPTSAARFVAEPESEDDEEEEAPAQLPPPNRRFPELHQTIRDTIQQLGGAVAPKLNWSAPKDAAWISRHQNTMKCTSPNDVYLLLKSSSFVSHDLEHAFDSCASSSAQSPPPAGNGAAFSPVLVLRAFFSPLPSLEFRCFVKDRTLVGITQRDLNHYGFLLSIREPIKQRVRELFDRKLRFTFPEASFVFDIYIPEADYDSDAEDDANHDSGSVRLGRARLIDFNPWAPHTDTLLFDWVELLDLRVPKPVLGAATDGQADKELVTDEEDDEEDEEDGYEPEVRLIEKDDPAAHNFSSPQYSAHKLPKEVVDASMAGEGGMREFARQWQRIVEGRGQDSSYDG
jgi:hypothetical protein